MSHSPTPQEGSKRAATTEEAVDNLASNVNSTRAASNGADTLQAASVARPAMRPSEAHHDRMAQSFANVVAVLMRDPGFRNLRLADLEWLVLPPILSGQWRLAHSSAQQPSAKAETKAGDAAPASRMLVPVAVALWASVSPEIDKRLSETLDKPMKLRPNEWLTGNIPWLVAVAGDRRAVPKFLKQLEENEFKGKQVKLRANGPDGKVVVKTLSQSE